MISDSKNKQKCIIRKIKYGSLLYVIIQSNKLSPAGLISDYLINLCVIQRWLYFLTIFFIFTSDQVAGRNALYVGYGAWFSIWGDEAWDNLNTKNGDRWKQISSGLISGSPSSVSSCFGGTKPVPFGTKEFQIQTRSVLVVDVVQVVELKQDGDEAILDNQYSSQSGYDYFDFIFFLFS